MTPKIAKFIVQALGALATLFGAVVLCGASALLFMQLDSLWSFVTVFLLLAFIIAIWLLWIGYLVWFRLSPLAIQQLCGALGACIIVPILVLTPPADEGVAFWYALAFLGWIAFVAAAYPLVNRYLVRKIFPPEHVLNTPVNSR